MIKTISIHQLTIGMYVQGLDCSWVNHPFMVNQFVIKSQEQINKIKSAGIRTLSIDTDKGVDVEGVVTAGESEKIAAEPPEVVVPAPSVPEKSSLKEELTRAATVKKEATQLVTKLMGDARLGKRITCHQVLPVVGNMVDSVMSNKDALLGLTRIRKLDKYSFEHSVGVSILLVAFGESIAFCDEDLVQLGIGGFLMDIGKSLAPEKLLNKPGKLSQSEYAVMQQHVEHSQKILLEMPDVSEIVMNIAMEHHERYDGSGYPGKLSGDGISIYGQMAAIVDVYDALTSRRAYSDGMAPHLAMKKLIAAGGQFNQELVLKFIHCVGVYPVGSLVVLSNGLFAVVLEQSKRGQLQPKIRIIFDSTKRQLIEARDLDLSDPDAKESLDIVGGVEPSKWRIKPQDYLDHARYSH